MAYRAKTAFEKWGPYLSYFSTRGRENFNVFRHAFNDHEVLFELSPSIVPYVFPMVTPFAEDLSRSYRKLEWISTLRKDLLLIPVIPLVSRQEVLMVTEEIKGKINGRAN